MSAFTEKTTITDAINMMLACAGESPISSYDDNTNVMARLAYNTLVEIHRAVLSKGWSFNTDLDYVLTPDNAGDIYIGDDIITADTSAYKDTSDPVVRGNRLYSRRDQTYTWTESIEVDFIRLMEFDDIPEPVRRYIAIRAARVFVARHVGDQATFQYSASDEGEALAAAQQSEAAQGDYNILSTPECQNIINRLP